MGNYEVTVIDCNVSVVKLTDPSTSAKTYWSIPKTFVNG